MDKFVTITKPSFNHVLDTDQKKLNPNQTKDLARQHSATQIEKYVPSTFVLAAMFKTPVFIIESQNHLESYHQPLSLSISSTPCMTNQTLSLIPISVCVQVGAHASVLS
jgi:hypothetical protein